MPIYRGSGSVCGAICPLRLLLEGGTGLLCVLREGGRFVSCGRAHVAGFSKYFFHAPWSTVGGDEIPIIECAHVGGGVVGFFSSPRGVAVRGILGCAPRGWPVCRRAALIDVSGQLVQRLLRAPSPIAVLLIETLD
jgi:hypothetical protein